jgi:uncharacterized protein YciI
MAVLIRYDYEDNELRARHREAHIARLANLAAGGKVLVAGPLANSSGAIVILDVDEEGAARQIMDNDPYLLSGAVISYSAELFQAVVSPSSDR